MPKLPPRASPTEPLQLRLPGDYPGIIAWSWLIMGLLALSLFFTDNLNISGVLLLRNVLGYGHFALAYLFTWRMIQRELGGLRPALVYLVVFFGIVVLYAAMQRWWVADPINDLFVMALFMVHHASNEILFRLQGRNEYRTFPWSPRYTLWVTLAVGLILLERVAALQFNHRIGVWLTALWLTGWIGYARFYLAREQYSRRSWVGWVAAMTAATICVCRPFGAAFFTSRLIFGWFVVYHYIIWYVFYTHKLMARTGRWLGSTASSRQLFAALWTYVTTVPAGFLGLILIGNLLIIAILIAVNPLTLWMHSTTHLDFFQVNTVAHICFGVGIRRFTKRTDPATVKPSSVTVPEQLPQFA